MILIITLEKNIPVDINRPKKAYLENDVYKPIEVLHSEDIFLLVRYFQYDRKVVKWRRRCRCETRTEANTKFTITITQDSNHRIRGQEQEFLQSFSSVVNIICSCLQKLSNPTLGLKYGSCQTPEK